MGRGEREDISGLNLPDPEKPDIIFLGLKGEQTEEKKALAKCVTVNNGYDNTSVQCFIRMGRGEIIDPYEIDFGYTNKKLASLKFKKVSKKAFDNYTKYLKCKNRLYFTKARRLAMEY
tara:strand:+ start:836 stop:1189 length:354 start_codon:yes stop_codon:yes gene_type:complete